MQKAAAVFALMFALQTAATPAGRFEEQAGQPHVPLERNALRRNPRAAKPV